MKVTALKEHKCYCCGGTIKKGDGCLVFAVSPSAPEKNEFDVIYTCSKCAEEESCRIRVKRSGASSQ